MLVNSLVKKAEIQEFPKGQITTLSQNDTILILDFNSSAESSFNLSIRCRHFSVSTLTVTQPRKVANC